MVVELVTVNEVQFDPPTVTVETLVKLVPVRVMVRPVVSVRPLLGLTDETVGGTATVA
jgi:hypothetical protein